MPSPSSSPAGADTPLPAVSVVLPVFNGAATLRAAIDSALSQDGVEVELVVVDDGSTDATAAILAGYATDQRVKPIRQEPNQGLVAALNRGVAAASHEVIARLDADDVALPGRLAHHVAAFAADPDLVLHATAYQRTLPDGTVLRTPSPPLTHGGLAMTSATGNRLCHSAVAFRRNAVLAVGGYRAERYPVEDFDLWVRLLAAGRYSGSGMVGTRYLANPDGISQRNEALQRELMQRIVDEYCVSLCGVESSPDGPVVRRLRHLASVRHGLLIALQQRTIPSDGVDEWAYRLAFDCTCGRHRLLQHALVATVAPSLWRAGRRLRP